MNRPPNSKVNLDRAIQRLYGTGARFVEYRSIIANTIVGQFLPDGVVKGGSALKLRSSRMSERVFRLVGVISRARSFGGLRPSRSGYQPSMSCSRST